MGTSKKRNFKNLELHPYVTVRKIVKGSQYQLQNNVRPIIQPVINLQGPDTTQQYEAATSGPHMTTTLINVSKKNNYNSYYESGKSASSSRLVSYIRGFKTN